MSVRVKRPPLVVVVVTVRPVTFKETDTPFSPVPDA
jgi:hypothetical protein